MSAPPLSAVAPRRSRRPIFVGAGAVILIAGLLVYRFWVAPTWSRTAAIEQAQQGDFAGAEPALLAAVHRNPHDVEVLEVLARNRVRTPEDDSAGDYLARWIDAQPENPEPRRLRLEYRNKRKEYDLALVDALMLAERSPNDPKPLRTALNVAIAAGEYAKAEELCRDALKQEPHDLALRVRLAAIRADRGDPAGAAALLEAVVRAQARNYGAMQLLAVQYLVLNQPEKAIPLLEDLVLNDPTRQRTAGYQLSLALERVGKPDAAKKVLQDVRRRQDVEVFRDAIKSQPDNLELQVRLAESLLADGHMQDALGFLQGVLNRDPGYAPAHRAMAAYYRTTGDMKRAAYHEQQAGAAP
jgi:predicted Zn-dependent protease